MAGITNIGGGDDQFNRYKMPELIGKVEGRGNGIKTRIVNLQQIGRSLHRRPAYICKFFGCELGAQTNIDDANGIYIVNGSHTAKNLKDILGKFIEMFVLCQSCKLPETDLKVRKNGLIVQKCNACGSTGMCDATHKLCTFIKNNPPSGGSKKGGKLTKEEKKKRKAKKGSKQDKDDGSAEEDTAMNNGAALGNGLGGSNEDVSTVNDGMDAGAGMFMMPSDDIGDLDGMMGGVGAFGLAGNGEEKEVEWSVDTSKEAQEARKKEIGEAAKILDRMNIEDENGADESKLKEKKLRDYIDEGKKASKVLSKAEKLFGSDRVVPGVMNAVVLGESVTTIPKVVESKAVPCFKDVEVDGLGEMLTKWVDEIARKDEKIAKVSPHILKAFYDEDVVSEDDIVSWYNRDGSKVARKSSKELVEWLQESEEEESDED